MQCDILSGTRKVGFLQAERQGLYMRFYGCVDTKDVTKIYGIYEGGSCGLGVPVPEGDKMVLRTCVPATSLPSGRLLMGEIRDEADGWTHFPGGKIRGVNYPEGLQKGDVLRFLWSAEEQIPAPEVMLFYKPVGEQEKTYLELDTGKLY